VLGVLDADAHLFEHQHRAATQLAAGVVGQEVEVTALVDGVRGVAGVEVFEVEVLDFGGDEERVALASAPRRARDATAGADSPRRAAVNVVDVTEDPGHPGALFVPGQELERGEVGSGEHVGFLGAREAVDGAAVKGHALIERVLEFGRRDVEGLVAPQHVGEPELHEAHAAFFDGSQHVLGLALHTSHSRTSRVVPS
jgi:hypothetical protein